jgi:hypothetical protein
MDLVIFVFVSKESSQDTLGLYMQEACSNRLYDFLGEVGSRPWYDCKGHGFVNRSSRFFSFLGAFSIFETLELVGDSFAASQQAVIQLLFDLQSSLLARGQEHSWGAIQHLQIGIIIGFFRFISRFVSTFISYLLIDILIIIILVIQGNLLKGMIS